MSRQYTQIGALRASVNGSPSGSLSLDGFVMTVQIAPNRRKQQGTRQPDYIVTEGGELLGCRVGALWVTTTSTGATMLSGSIDCDGFPLGVVIFACGRKRPGQPDFTIKAALDEKAIVEDALAGQGGKEFKFGCA